MGLQLNKIFDPRDNLEKARRKEIEKFAKQHGVDEIKPGMPAPLMRRILRSKGLTGIMIPSTRWLGGPPDGPRGESIVNDPLPPDAEVNEVDALELLEREWSKPDYSSMKINELRAAAKKAGIKFSRTDKLPDMVRKLNGENAT